MPVSKWVSIPLGVIGHIPMARLELLENLSQPDIPSTTAHSLLSLSGLSCSKQGYC